MLLASPCRLCCGQRVWLPTAVLLRARDTCSAKQVRVARAARTRVIRLGLARSWVDPGPAAAADAFSGVMRTPTPAGNLKAFTGVSHPTPLIDELALAICEHHTALEHLCLQQQFNAWSVITSSLLQQPHAQSLRAFPVSFVDCCVGLGVASAAGHQRRGGWGVLNN